MSTEEFAGTFNAKAAVAVGERERRTAASTVPGSHRPQWPLR